MDLTPYVDLLRRELATVADGDSEEAQALANRLSAQLDSAVRLTLLEALSSATAEITRELAPGSVHVRLRGRDPDFVVTTAAPTDEQPQGDFAPSVSTAPRVSTAPDAAVDDTAEKGGSSRINLRLPDDVKGRVEEAATRERISVNAWLVRAAVAGLEPGRSWAGTGARATSRGQRFTGWSR